MFPTKTKVPTTDETIKWIDTQLLKQAGEGKLNYSLNQLHYTAELMGFDQNFDEAIDIMRRKNFVIYNQPYALSLDSEWICFASPVLGPEAVALFEVAEPVHVHKTVENLQLAVMEAKANGCDRVEFEETAIGLGEKGRDRIIHDVEKELRKLGYQTTSYIHVGRGQAPNRILVIPC